MLLDATGQQILGVKIDVEHFWCVQKISLFFVSCSYLVDYTRQRILGFGVIFHPKNH